jgi:hypothetical protein
MIRRHSKLKAAITLVLATSVAAGGFGQALCAGNPCADSSGTSPRCCGPQCVCPEAATEVRACCCGKHQSSPSPVPARMSAKAGVELSWIPWASPPAALVAIAALPHAGESVSSSPAIERSVQSVLCIWRI